MVHQATGTFSARSSGEKLKGYPLKAVVKLLFGSTLLTQRVVEGMSENAASEQMLDAIVRYEIARTRCIVQRGKVGSSPTCALFPRLGWWKIFYWTKGNASHHEKQKAGYSQISCSASIRLFAKHSSCVLLRASGHSETSSSRTHFPLTPNTPWKRKAKRSGKQLCKKENWQSRTDPGYAMLSLWRRVIERRMKPGLWICKRFGSLQREEGILISGPGPLFDQFTKN